MSYEPSGLSGHHLGEINRGFGGTGNSSIYTNTIVNGGVVSRQNEGDKKRNFKLLIDPVLKGRGHQKIYRFDGNFEGQAPVVPKDPRSRRTRLWSTGTKADLPVPKFKIDKFYVGIPPQRDIILNGLNDNVDRKFLHQICEKFGNIEGIKIFYDPLTKRHLGKARVGFSTSASAKLAVAKLEGTSIMGCIVHADFEHKVEVKPPPSKTPATQHIPNSAFKTSPPTEKPLPHLVLPTPPTSASSHSPTNSTPSTPGILGLVDPRTRGHSTSSVSTEKVGGSSPSRMQQQPNQSNNKAPVFEPISPPCEQVKLTPPPPPSPPEKNYSSTPATLGEKHQDSSKKQGKILKDTKGLHSKSSRDSYRNNRQSDKDSDWRRRDRESVRDRRDHRSRWDDRGSSYYTEKESRYSSYKDYSSKGRSGSESRDGYSKNESRKSGSRDNDNRRRRDSDESCNSEKGSKNWKPVNEPSTDMDSNDSRTITQKPKESMISFSIEPLSKGVTSLHASFSDGLSKGSTLSSVNALQNLCTNNDATKENGDQNHSLSIVDVGGNSVGGNVEGVLNRVSAENESKSTVADVKNGSDCLPDQERTSKMQENSLQIGDIGYYPMVEDISPVSSPNATKISTCTAYQTLIPDHSDVTLGNQLRLSEEQSAYKDPQGVTEDDDAMSLSSISSNDETFEVTKPERVPPITVPPPTIPYPPPSFVPPPFIPPFDPTVPPPSLSILPPLQITLPLPPIQTLAPPPHPLVPPSFLPSFPPQFASTIAGVPPLPVQSQYQPYTSGHLQPSHEQRLPLKKTWKAKISDECLRIVSKELELILKRDVNKRLVENSAFKALDGWWDNLGKTKTPTQQAPTPAVVSQSPLLSSTNQADITSSPLFSTSMNQSGGLGIGLRASLPKMPSFRKRPLPTASGADLYVKRKRGDSSSEADTKGGMVGNDLYDQNDSMDSYQSKKHETVGQLSQGDNSAFLWPQAEDGIDGPPATSVRTEEKHPTPGSSLYTNIYSSFSESGSSVGGDGSESESSREEDSDWDESERSDSSSGSASEYSSDEEDGKDTMKSSDQMSEMITGIPHTPPGTPPESPPEILPAPRTPSITPPPSPPDSQSLVTEEPEGSTVVDVKLEDNDGHVQSAGSSMHGDFKTVTLVDYSSSETEKSDSGQDLVTVSKDGFNETDLHKIARDDTKNDIQKSEEPASPMKLDLEKTQSVTQEPISETTDNEELSVTMDAPPKPVYKPVFEPPPQFPLRAYIQDDQLVFDFLVSGLDYEDASYLKIGFERLVQVGSDSITDAHWAFHPTTFASVPTKGRKQKSDNYGVRVHSSGAARCEGFYKISMAEKAKYLEAARRQLDRTQAVDYKKTEEKEANKAKQQSRENRALQRRLAASFQNEDFGDILKFNQLKVRKKKLTFCKSRIHDWGLFALEPIGPDEMVIEYVGEVVRQTTADHREKFYERVGIGSSYLFRVDTDTIIDATKYGNLARFINHCCEPNCYAKVVTLESEKKIVIYSKRDIAVNEEITYDYKFPIEDDKIPCLCGATQCRGTLN